MSHRGKEKITPEVQDIICKCLRAGNTINASAQSAGITPQTLNAWLRKGKKIGSGKYFQFYEAVKKAEADAQVHAVAIIRSAMSKSWQAAAWWLERKFPADWALRQYVEQKNIDGGKDAIAEKAEKDERVRKALLDLQECLDRKPDDAGDPSGIGEDSEQ